VLKGIVRAQKLKNLIMSWATYICQASREKCWPFSWLYFNTAHATKSDK